MLSPEIFTHDKHWSQLSYCDLLKNIIVWFTSIWIFFQAIASIFNRWRWHRQKLLILFYRNTNICKNKLNYRIVWANNWMWCTKFLDSESFLGKYWDMRWSEFGKFLGQLQVLGIGLGWEIWELFGWKYKKASEVRNRTARLGFVRWQALSWRLGCGTLGQNEDLGMRAEDFWGLFGIVGFSGRSLRCVM